MEILRTAKEVRNPRYVELEVDSTVRGVRWGNPFETGELMSPASGRPASFDGGSYVVLDGLSGRPDPSTEGDRPDAGEVGRLGARATHDYRMVLSSDELASVVERVLNDACADDSAKPIAAAIAAYIRKALPASVR